jgi:outer membrane protein insertion porin family
VNLAKDGNTLVVQVIERPTITKLTLKGIKDKEKMEKLLREAGVAEGRLYDPAVIARGQKELEKHYYGKGKYSVRIESEVKPINDAQMDVVYSIYEGDAAKIKLIKIIGNTAFTEDELTKDFHSKKSNMMSWFSSDDMYAKEKLQADLETLRSYYMDRGYIQFQVNSSQVSLSTDKKRIDITIDITEGDKYKFGSVKIDEPEPVVGAHLETLVGPIKQGQTFSRKTLLAVKQALEDKLGQEGYSMAEARISHNVDEATKEVTIIFHIIPGKRMYVNRIIFKGNLTTKDEVLRRELPQMEGTWISTTQVKEGKEKILRRGYGSNVEVEHVPVSDCDDKLDIVYAIEEAKLGQVGAGIGYSGTEKLMFNFSISQENFFGTGKAVDFKWDQSKACSNYQLDYMDPYFTVDGVGMGVSGYYNKTSLGKTSDTSKFTTDTIGGSLRWLFPMSQFDFFHIQTGYDNTRLKLNRDRRNVATQILNFVHKYGNQFEEVTFGIGWSHNSLNHRLFPTCGYIQKFNLNTVVPGAKQKYYIASYNLAFYQPLDECERWVINVNSNMAYGNGYGKTHQLPFYRNFYAGGTRFVRGFEENSLGPTDSLGNAFGGNALVSGTFAVIFPNPIKPDLKSVRTSLFFDAGQVYYTPSQKPGINSIAPTTRPAGIRCSVGVSLTWDTPLGAPISFSYAIPLKTKVNDDTRPFTFWMGTQF